MKNLMRLLYVLVGLGVAGPVHAVLTIEITQGVEGALPIAVVPFEAAGDPGIELAAIIAADLHRSGRFSPLPEADMLSRPTDRSEVQFRDWRLLGVDSLVVGTVRSIGDGFEVRFQLFDVNRRTRLTGLTFRVDRGGLRRVAHQIADVIYETLLGEPGAFATRIAYVTETEDDEGVRRYTLEVADSDGHDPRRVLVSTQPLMSPAWAPEGKRLAYVSFESGAPAVYVQDLDTGARKAVSSHRGLNSAPAWSPDGRQLALVLSRDGSPSLYVLELSSGRLQQLTRGFSIDTEPVWSPDGSTLYFTSDRGGKPQIYRVPSEGGRVERVTFEGGYNARPVVSGNGRLLAMVHGASRGFNIGVMDLSNGSFRILTDGGRDESPSFAPNDSMLIYATREGARGYLSVVSVDGRVRQRLMFEGGQAREPAWSPYLK